MEKSLIENLIKVGWHLRDEYVWHPERQTKPKDVEIAELAEGFLKRFKNGGLENEQMGDGETGRRDRDHNCCVWFNPGSN